MSVIADFSIPAEEFPLGDLLEVRKGVHIRLESMIPTGGAVLPYFWVRSPDVEAVEAALQGSEIVEDVLLVDEIGDETLFRVAWSDDVNGFIDAIITSDAVVLDGEGHGDVWSFQMRFPEYDNLSTFYRSVVDRGITIDLEGVHDSIEASSTPAFGLTDEQREVLVLALEGGYFAVPREMTMVEVAEELGISDSAVSQRIRRGLAKVLAASLQHRGS